jgi:hypothetical protein
MNKPEANKTYMLIGGSNVKSIANGDPLAECEIKPVVKKARRMNEEAIKKIINVVLASIKEHSFVDGYDVSDEEAFGLMMSKYFEYGGYEIAEAAGNALEDANFHGWAKILRDTELMDHVAKGGK